MYELLIVAMQSFDAKARNLFLEHANTVLLCRYAVKTVIDKASVKNVEEDCDDVVNLIAAIEQVLSHGIKKTRNYYEFVAAACRKLPNQCLPTIEALGFLKHGHAKGRAWLKLALMEKQLSFYLTAALQQRPLVRNFYNDHAIILSDDMNILVQDLVGLSALDFRFCLRNDTSHPEELMLVDLAPYLRFQQCAESVLSDIQEASRSAATDSSTWRNCQCGGSQCGGPVKDGQNYAEWQEKFEDLQTLYKQLCDQKASLEATCKQQSRQLSDSQHRLKQLCQRMSSDSAAWACERRRLEHLVAGLRLDLFALVDTSANNCIGTNMYESGVMNINDHCDGKEDSHSLKPLVGSLYSQAAGIVSSDRAGLDNDIDIDHSTNGFCEDECKTSAFDNSSRYLSAPLPVRQTPHCPPEGNRGYGDAETQRAVLTGVGMTNHSQLMERCQFCSDLECNTIVGAAINTSDGNEM